MAIFSRTESAPDRTPRDNTVVAQPATPDTCAKDYAKAASIRATAEQQWAKER